MSEETFDRLCMLPNGWLVKTINDITIRVGSGVTPTGGSEVYSDSGVIFVRSQNVTNSGLLLDDVAFIDTLTHEKMRSSELLPFDVLLNITGASIGRCCVFPQEIGSANVNQHVCTIRLKSPNYMEAKFLALLFVSPLGQNQIFRLNAGGNREGLNYQQIRSMCFSFPPLPQQRKIAKILTTVDNLIEKTESLIAKYQSIKQGMMHDLFTRGVDAKGKLRPPQSDAPELYKQSELGWIPKEWEVERLVDASDFLDGKRVPLKQEVRDLIEGEYPYYGASGIIDFINDYIFDDELILVGEDGENVISRNLPLAFKVTGKCWVNNHAHVLKPHKNVDIDYLTEFLEALDYKNIVSGSAQPKINQQKLAKTMVVLPTLIEQIRISKLLCNISLNIKNEVLNHFKMQFLKTALMQDLLTGKVKVSPDAEDKELAHA